MEELRDIKDIVPVNEYSLFILLSMVILSVLIVFVFLYFYNKRDYKFKHLSPKEIALKNLKNINFSDTKSSVYSFIIDGEIFVSDKNSKVFREIEQKLTVYKYKKNVDKLDPSLIQKMKAFISDIK